MFILLSSLLATFPSAAHPPAVILAQIEGVRTDIACRDAAPVFAFMVENASELPLDVSSLGFTVVIDEGDLEGNELIASAWINNDDGGVSSPEAVSSDGSIDFALTATTIDPGDVLAMALWVNMSPAECSSMEGSVFHIELNPSDVEAWYYDHEARLITPPTVIVGPEITAHDVFHSY